MVQRVFIVEDSKRFAELIEELLSYDGFSVDVITERFDTVMQQVRERLPSLILLDRRLGNVDGYDLCIRLREQHPSIHIILMTGEADTQTILERCLPDAILVKPFALDRLIDTVKGLMRAP